MKVNPATKGQTAEQVIACAYQRQPHLKLAMSMSGESIGSWDPHQERYVAVGMRLDDYWAPLEYELWVDGAPVVTEWVPVPCIA